MSGAFNIASGVFDHHQSFSCDDDEMTDVEATIEYTETRKGAVRDSRADISAARATLGYEPKGA